MSFYHRHRRTIFFATLLAVPLCVFGAKQAWDRNTNRVEDWLPASFDETQRLMWFIDHFGSDEILVVSWPGCNLDDPRLAEFVRAVLAPCDRGSLAGQKLFRRAWSGPDVIRALTREPLELSEGEALERLDGWLVGPDRYTTCAMALVSDVGLTHRRAAIDWVYRCAHQACGLETHEVHVAGSSVDGVAIDRASQSALLALNGYSFAVCLLLLCVLLRSLRIPLVIFGTVILCQQLSLALVYYTGATMDSVLLMMASLVFVLAVSAAVHLMHYYRDAVTEVGPGPAAAGRAVALAAVPSTLAAATTSLGLASLAVSEITPIVRFGLLSAVAVPLAVAVVFIVVPAALAQWPPGPRALRQARQARHAVARYAVARHAVARPGGAPSSGGLWFAGPWRGGDRAEFWPALADLVERRWAVIVSTALVVLVFGGLGVARLRTTVEVQAMLSPDDKLVGDYRWLQSQIGALAPIEVVIRFPASTPLSLLERLLVVDSVRREIESLSEVDATISAANFSPSLAGLFGSSLRQTARRRVVERALDRQRPTLVDIQYLAETDSEQLWRITARVPSGASVDYGDLLATLPERVAPLLAVRPLHVPAPGRESRGAGAAADPAAAANASANAKANANASAVATANEDASAGAGAETGADRGGGEHPASPGPPIAQATFCGGVPLVHQAQHELLADLLESYLTAFVLIALVFGMILRRGTAALLAMLPNLVPTIGVFGLLGWLGYRVEIGSMLTASTALGIAVDGTLHYLTWFRRGIRRGETPRGAIQYAYQHCGLAVAQTTLICSLGLLVFAGSPFLPIARFAWLMFTLLSVALACDLILLPAILVGPLGRTFLPRTNEEPLIERATLEQVAPEI